MADKFALIAALKVHFGHDNFTLIDGITVVDENTDESFSVSELPLILPEEVIPSASLSRAAFVVALTKTTPPILTSAEALAALETFPPKFMPALANKPLEYQAAAIEAWRETKTVERDAPMFLDLLAFYAAMLGLSDMQAKALGDTIFAIANI